MRITFAAFLLLHGIAHLVGFLNPFGLAPARAPGQPPPPRPDALFDGKILIGDAAARSLGLVWLLIAIVFAFVAVGVVRDASWWPATLAAAAVASLAMSVAFWPAARIGVWIDAVLLAALAVLLAVGRPGA